MANKYILASDGAKSLDLASPIRDSWDFVDAMKKTQDSDLYACVSAVYRAMNLTADAISNLPFAVLKGDEIIDSSAAWKNVIGIMPRPRELLRLWRLSLFMNNKAYARIAKTRPGKREMFYVAPETIKPIVSKDGGLEKFERWLEGVKVAEYKPLENFLYMWRQDHTTELLPSENTEFRALAQSAGILFAADWWTENYFKRGAVKPTILAVKGLVVGDKKDELQSSWGKFIRNVSTELSKIINSEAMDVKTIGDGLGDVKDSPVYKQAIENVAMASGMPLSLLLANSANYATAQTERAAWFNDSVLPWAYWMAENLNEQVFQPAGLYFEFQPEASEPGQEEEVQRASAYSTYISAGLKPSVAAQIVGLDLPSGVEYEDLDEPEEAPEVESEMTEPEAPEEVEEDLDELPAKAWDELNTWRKKALRLAKRGKPVTFEFITEHLPAKFAELVRKRLQFAGTPNEVKSAFDIERTEEPQNEEIKALADAINKLAEKPEEVKATPPVFNFTMPAITLNANMPAQDTPTVTVNIPDQPAPVVEFTAPETVVNVAAPVVNIENNMPPAEVTVNAEVTLPERKPITAELTTDPHTGKKILKAK